MGLVSFVDKGSENDDVTLRSAAIDPFEDASLPYYARWTRQDIVAVVYLLNHIRALLIFIAVALAIIAFR